MTLDDTIALITESAREHGIAPAVTAKLIADLKRAAQEAKAERAAEPKKKAKTQFVVLAAPKGDATEQVGWILQLEKTADPAVVLSRVKEAAYAFNSSKRGRKIPVNTIGEAMETLSTKWFKQTASAPGQKTLVKTKTPIVLQLIPDLKLPR